MCIRDRCSLTGRRRVLIRDTRSRLTGPGCKMPTMRRRLLAALTASVIAVVVFAYVGAPYARAASFIVRAAGLGGRAEEFANRQSRKVTIQPRHQVSTRYGDVPARMYV